MKLRTLTILWCLLLASGCTTFKVDQKDESPERTISSSIKGTAWFSSAQNISRIKALQTDKSQSFGSDGIGQQGATNMVEALGHIKGILEAIKP